VIGTIYLAQYDQDQIFRNTVGQNPPLMHPKYGTCPIEQTPYCDDGVSSLPFVILHTLLIIYFFMLLF